MKQLLMSIQPQHLYNILTGKKTLEIRKQIPKGFKGWVNLYCTKGKPYLVEVQKYGWIQSDFKYASSADTTRIISSEKILNGKVVARFWFDEYRCAQPKYHNEMFADYEKEMCLTWEEFMNYGKGKDLYAMHINNLEIFDKPKALSEFRYASKKVLIDNNVKSMKFYKPSLYTDIVDNVPQMIYRVTKAPQNYMYVEVEE